MLTVNPETRLFNPSSPSKTLLVKLTSLIVHYQELVSPSGHPMDKIEIEQLEKDPEVKAWFKHMAELQLLPIKRSQPAYGRSIQ